MSRTIILHFYSIGSECEEIELTSRNMRKKNNTVCNKETSTNIGYFAFLPEGLLLKERIYRFQNRDYFKRKEFASSGSKFLPLRVTPILEAILGRKFQEFSWVCIRIIPF